MADEQVGNNNWTTMTPGSAVAGQLQNILTQKRLEARQAMLDQLHSQDVQSQIRDRDEATLSQKEFRESNASNRAAQELQRRLGLMSPGQDLAPGDETYLQQNAPSMIDPAQPASPQFQYEGQPDLPGHGPRFHGLPKDLELERKTRIQESAMSQLNSPGFKDLPIVQQAQIYKLATGSEPAAGLLNLPDKEPWEPVFDANGTNTGNWAPKGAHFLPREPKEPQGPGFSPFTGTDIDGNPANLGFNPKTNAYEPSKVPAGIRIGGKAGVPRTVVPRPAKVSPQTWGLWSQAVDKLQRSPGDARVEADLQAQAARIAQELGLGTELSKPILDIFKDPRNRTRTPKIHNTDAADQEASQQLWNLLTGGFQGQPQ